MDTGGPPDCGLRAAVDVHDLSTGGARAAAVLAADATFAHVLAGRTAAVPRAAPYQPGEFYLRELPRCAAPDGLNGLGLLVTDGNADLDPDARPGPGAHVQAESAIPATAVATSRFRTPPARCRSGGDPLCARCSSPRPRCPPPTPRTWPGAWQAGTGCPPRRAARHPSPEQARPQPS